jgi:hypothetical protein
MDDGTITSSQKGTHSLQKQHLHPAAARELPFSAVLETGHQHADQQ